MAGFRRSVSLPALTAAAKRSAYRIRSASLPVRFHPIVSRLNDDVASLMSWSSSFVLSPSATWLNEGVNHISIVLASLFQLMQHPLAVDQLRDSPFTSEVSDDMLRLVDSYNSFRLALVNLVQLQAETRASLRRRDPSRMSLAIRAQRLVGQELECLASTAQAAAQAKSLPPGNASASADATGVSTLPLGLCSATAALAAASAVVFIGIAALSDQSTILSMPVAVAPARGTRNVRWVGGVMRLRSGVKKHAGTEEERKARREAVERFDRLEECLKQMESSVDELYRSLVTARVFLLNVLSSAF